MSAPRTVTVHTVDHGPVTFTCPSWCTGGHAASGHRADIMHLGPLHSAAWNGYEMAVAQLAQYPYAELSTHELVASVGMGELSQSLLPGDLDDVAAALTEFVADLRRLARQAARLRAGGAR